MNKTPYCLHIYLKSQRGTKIYDALIKMANDHDRSQSYLGVEALEKYLIDKGYLDA